MKIKIISDGSPCFSAMSASYATYASSPMRGNSLVQPKSETSILTMKGGSPHSGPQSPPGVFLSPGYNQTSPSNPGNQSQLFIEVKSQLVHDHS